MRKIVEKKGITLIALVITIIVLLILAGITINLTIGQNGIMNMAQKAGKNYINAQNAENTEIGEITNQVDSFFLGTTREEKDWTVEEISLPFTAPEDGFLQVNLFADTTGNAYLYLRTTSNIIRSTCFIGWSTTNMGFVKKGDTISVEASGNVKQYRIYYIH